MHRGSAGPVPLRQQFGVTRIAVHQIDFAVKSVAHRPFPVGTCAHVPVLFLVQNMQRFVLKADIRDTVRFLQHLLVLGPDRKECLIRPPPHFMRYPLIVRLFVERLVCPSVCIDDPDSLLRIAAGFPAVHYQPAYRRMPLAMTNAKVAVD